MTINECFQLGYVIKPHGLNGEVDVFLDTDYPENYMHLESTFVEIKQKLVPFFIEYIKVRGNKALIKFKEIDSVENSKKLKGCTLHLPATLLPPLKGNTFYFHEVIGYDVVDDIEGTLGQVVKFYNYPNQDLLVVKYREKEVLIPLNDDIIIHVNRSKKQIEVALPTGLLEIYLDN